MLTLRSVDFAKFFGSYFFLIFFLCPCKKNINDEEMNEDNDDDEISQSTICNL